jgi:hypothetical protein
MSTSWTQHWIAVGRIVDADPELQLLAERMKPLVYGSPAHRRLHRQWDARHFAVREQARLDVTAAEVDAERADRAAYMREYRANKRAVREAVDARRKAATT